MTIPTIKRRKSDPKWAKYRATLLSGSYLFCQKRPRPTSADPYLGWDLRNIGAFEFFAGTSPPRDPSKTLRRIVG